MRRAVTTRRPRREGWRLALNLSVVACLGGLLFLLIGSWTNASAAFAFGVVCAAIAALSLRRRSG
jgi:hypothetical protein